MIMILGCYYNRLPMRERALCVLEKSPHLTSFIVSFEHLPPASFDAPIKEYFRVINCRFVSDAKHVLYGKNRLSVSLSVALFAHHQSFSHTLSRIILIQSPEKLTIVAMRLIHLLFLNCWVILWHPRPVYGWHDCQVFFLPPYNAHFPVLSHCRVWIVHQYVCNSRSSMVFILGVWSFVSEWFISLNCGGKERKTCDWWSHRDSIAFILSKRIRHPLVQLIYIRVERLIAF